MLNSTGIFNALISHAEASGLFETVNGHEPKSSPGKGITAAIWVARVDPARGSSGLASTAVRLTYTVRIFSDMLQEPQDGIDPAVLAAVDALMNAYSGDFTLGGLIRNVDLLGQTGAPLFAQSGYLNVSGRMFRIMDVSVPMVVSDVWEQVP
ncbi:hypothetical protein GCM10022254_09960 [Actinomadura meridiana]|uniref:Uncharacterized protein n=1 Tax=Actinomadura meridiana TaxID=559626 RepID=A0ABP8BUA9_9ACTN